MRLIDLDPNWVDAGGDGVTRNGEPVLLRRGVGVSFNCPCGCSARCFIPFTQPLDGGPPYIQGHPTWGRTGETFEELTLAPSIQRVGGCAWHGFIEAGTIRNC